MKKSSSRSNSSMIPISISKYKKFHSKNLLYQLYQFIHQHVQIMNGSKIFAGLVVVVLNIASRFATIKLSKSMESYFRHAFSRDILVFCIVWMGCREIYTALFVTLLFILFFDFLFNEDSRYYVLPKSFTEHYVSLLETNVSKEEYQKAKETIEKFEQQTSTNKDKKSEENKELPSSMSFTRP